MAFAVRQVQHDVAPVIEPDGGHLTVKVVLAEDLVAGRDRDRAGRFGVHVKVPVVRLRGSIGSIGPIRAIWGVIEVTCSPPSSTSALSVKRTPPVGGRQP